MTRSRTRVASRRGTVLVCVLACLGVVVVMVMFTVQSSLRGRKQARQQRQLIQTELLCEAGVKRAVQQLTKSPSYRGEKWTPRLQHTSYEAAVISISLRPLVEKPNFMLAEIVASIASAENSSDRIQRTHSFEINLTNPTQESNP